MRQQIIPTFLVLFLSVVNADGAGFDPAFRAAYRVTFEADWSSQTHPLDFPSSAHFSPLVGMTHRSQASIWQAGQIASNGIELMAELGGTGVLSDEISTIINTGHAEFLLQGQGVGQSPGSTSFEFDVSQSFPLVSLVSMIAPSPDWFVGVNSLNLRENGDWVDQMSIDLMPYDAGTDSGVSFSSSNANTDPAQRISRITETPFSNSVPLGRFVFQLIDTSSNFPISGYQSGLYYDPDRSGEGINLIISEQGSRRTAAFNWYTYNTNKQLWLAGNVEIEAGADNLVIDVIRTEGTGFGQAFNSDDIQTVPWGTVTLSFPACDKIIVDYSSGEFGSGRQELTKLLGVSDLACQ